MKLILFAPELFLLLGCLALFFLSTGRTQGRTARGAAIAVAVGTLLVSLLCLRQEGHLFYEAYRIDFFSQFLKLVITAGLAAVLLFSTELKGVDEEVRPEYYLFLSLSTLGLLMLVSSVELITLFISLELSSYALYLLVPLRDDKGGLRVQMEAAIKCILFGVVATGIMLFGMSYLFGLAGTTYFVDLVPALQGMMSSPVALVAILMFMGGLFFKLAVFPFHFWVPDVYQGASNETTAFIASVPKVAAVAVLIRIATLATPDGQMLVTMLAVLAVCSMLYGNLSALVQTDIKRMLGFSGIAHAGYVLLGLVTLQESGYAISLYYVIGYLLMTLAGFLVICKVSSQGENLRIEDLGGLHRRAPLLALTLAVSMFAMAGIPPFVGFMGKFMLLTGAYKAGHLALVIIAAINTAISIYYYLSVVRVVYTSGEEERPAVAVDGLTRAVSLALVVMIIALGVAPNQLVALATEAVRAIL
jgi:NADH-quinone oxidoreductase subunit N